MIEITDSAARVIARQLEKNARPDGGLRIAVKAGGCSGFAYQFAWDDAARENDQVFVGSGGAKVFVDPRSLKMLDGTVLDFDEGNLLATSFTLKNPHATSTCGCGESFSANVGNRESGTGNRETL
jgi:iron-sulfur cluster assembly accessory protein